MINKVRLLISFIMLAAAIYAQESRVQTEIGTDTLLAIDSLIYAKPETVYVKKIEYVSVPRGGLSSPSIDIESKKKERRGEDATESTEFFTSWFESVNFFSVVNIFFVLLIAYFLNRLIDRVRKSAFIKGYTYGQKYLFYFKLIIWIITYIIILNVLFLDLDNAILILVGMLAVIVFIAMLPIIKNFLGGFQLLIDKPFSEGDTIAIADDAGCSLNSIKSQSGRVNSIKFRYTLVHSDEGRVINIPNSLFLENSFQLIPLEERGKHIELDINLDFEIKQEDVLSVLREIVISCPYCNYKKEISIYLKQINSKERVAVFNVALHIWDSNYEDETINYINMKVLVELKRLSPMNRDIAHFSYSKQLNSDD